MQVYEFSVVRLFLMMLYAVLELHLLGLGQSLAVFYDSFLVVGLPLIVHARLGFQDLFPFSLCSLILLHFSSLVTSLVALHFAMFATQGLHSVFFRVWISFVYVLWASKIISCLKLELWFLCGVFYLLAGGSVLVK
ncbi:hypothetical protein HID58_043950 [Brassica napus]|uniref:Uncharacterized protein n=1 Tax=Brassica napus TaxID=3708 RepID=A0ABQ8BJ19_BRANA|nr:hypothetical protein HID58_043950 [Brassica napus]